MDIEFGEKLLWMVRQKNRLEKLNPGWECGMFVGVKATSCEVWAAIIGRSAGSEVGEENLCGRAVGREEQRILSSMCRGTKAEKTLKQTEIFQEHLKEQQRQERLLRGRWTHSEFARWRVHHEIPTSRRRMLKHTDTPRAVQVAEPCSKVAPGRRTRRSAERGSET